MPVVEFAFPGPLRDSLVALVLSGYKSATTGLLAEYEAAGESLPTTDLRQGVVDSSGEIVGIIETVSVDVVRLGDVSLSHVRDEGEGHTTVTGWRRAHEEFWHSEEMRRILGDPEFTIDDDTKVVLERFRLVSS